MRRSLTPFLLFCLLAVVAGCSMDKDPDAGVASGDGSIEEHPGILLYANHCQSCHGALVTSTKRERSAEEILAALSIPEMVFLKAKLSRDDIAAIAAVLSSQRDTVAPSIPSRLAATVLGSQSVGLTWTASTDNDGGAGLKGYKLYRNDTLIGTLSATVSEYIDTGLTPDTSYSYRLLAYDNLFNSSPKSPAVTVRTSKESSSPDTTAPAAPTGLQVVKVSPTRLRISWVAVSDNEGGSGIKNYRLYRQGIFLSDVLPTTTNYLDTDLVSAASYTYQVTAIDNAGNQSPKSLAISVVTDGVVGATLYANRCENCHLKLEESSKKGTTSSAIAAAIANVPSMKENADYKLEELGADEIAAIVAVLSNQTDTTAPSVPSGLQAQAPAAGLVNLKWTASTDVGSGVRRYRIFRGTISIGAVNSPTITYQDSGLTSATTYSYSVKAEDNAGNLSAPSTAVTVTTLAAPDMSDTTAPSAPLNLTATASASAVNLSWMASTDNPGGTGVVKYKVYRNGVSLPSLSVTGTTAVDTGVSYSTSYSYKVSAVDGAGNESTFSNTQSVMTLVADGAAIYEAKGCYVCHNAPGSTAFRQSNLLGRGYTPAIFTSKFNSAVSGGQTQMSNIKLTPSEVASLADLFDGDSTTDPGTPAAESAFSYSVPTGTREYESSLLGRLFATPAGSTVDDTAVLRILAERIDNNAPALGGNCTRYDGKKCAASRTNHDLFASAKMLPLQSAARNGHLLEACAEISSIDNALINVLGRAGLTTASAGNAANVSAVYSIFFPERVPDALSVNRLVALHANSVTQGLNGVECWRLVILPLCESATTGGF